MEDRLAELETRVAFQDNTIQELNDVIIRQQQQIDRLTKDLEMLKEQLRNLAPSLIAAQSEETPPPHY